MSHEELTDMNEYAEARTLLGRALGEEPTMNFHPTSVLAAAKRSVARGRAWAAGGIAAGVVVIGIGGAALASPFGGSDATPAGVPTPEPTTITVSPTGPTTPSPTTIRPTATVSPSPTAGRPEPTTVVPEPTATTRPQPTSTVTTRPEPIPTTKR